LDIPVRQVQLLVKQEVLVIRVPQVL